MSQNNLVKLFVYGGLMSSNIRKYKGIKINKHKIRYGFIRGWKLKYNRKVRNCFQSKYHVQNTPDCVYFGMLNIVPNENQRHKVFGKILYIKPKQLRKIMTMEPGYKLVYINAQDLYTLTCIDKKYLDDSLQPNPIYKRLVELERKKVKAKLK